MSFREMVGQDLGACCLVPTMLARYAKMLGKLWMRRCRILVVEVAERHEVACDAVLSRLSM